MRIKTVSIERYKNLHDFECEFSAFMKPLERNPLQVAAKDSR